MLRDKQETRSALYFFVSAQIMRTFKVSEIINGLSYYISWVIPVLVALNLEVPHPSSHKNKSSEFTKYIFLQL